LACSVFSGGAKAPATEVAPNSGGGLATQSPSGGNTAEPAATTAEKPSGGYETEFPLPPDVTNFMSTGNGGINFQTKMSLKEAIAFYREAFAKAGYKERQITTVINDTTFSLVFDGHASGKAIVIQGVDLGGGNLNINLRFEDV
jgi:hypothetical protein